MDIKTMTEQIVRMFKEYDRQGTKTWTYEIAAQDLQYQIGNLTKRILQLKGYRYAEGLNEEEIKEKLADELADIMAETLFIAHELNIDLAAAWNAMLASDAKKIEERSKNS